jgi:hypothetical protein
VEARGRSPLLDISVVEIEALVEVEALGLDGQSSMAQLGEIERRNQGVETRSGIDGGGQAGHDG